MGRETERKFLVKDEEWRDYVRKHCEIAQRTILRDPDGSIARVRRAGDSATVTLKGPKVGGLSGPEFEWNITLETLEGILFAFGRGGIQKTRHEVVTADGEPVWEVDVFHGANDGLIMAEIEFKGEGSVEAAKAFRALPMWLGEEVTGDLRYMNSHLERHPWPTWGEPNDCGVCAIHRARK